MENKIVEDIQIIMNQTTYTQQEAYDKLCIHNFDKIKVIKEYMNIPLQSEIKKQIKSVNQEIYKQIRKERNTSMYKYNQDHPVDMNLVINNLNESEKRSHLHKNH